MTLRKSGAVLLSAVAVVGGLMFGAAGTASASTAATSPSGGRVVIAPPAPHAATPRGVTAAEPTISPSVPAQHGAPGTPFTCSAGNLCLVVWDPVTNDWVLYRLFTCSTYTVSNWNGDGAYYDNQTGNVTTYFYDQNYNVLDSFTPDATEHSYNWNPVWHVRNC